MDRSICCWRWTARATRYKTAPGLKAVDDNPPTLPPSVSVALFNSATSDPAMVHRVLVFGASGLMMRHVIPHIVRRFDLKVTAFIRPGSKGIPALRKLDVDILEGSWTDEDLIKRTIKDFDIIWDAGDSHDPSLPALLIPLLEQSASKPTYLRYTGTGNWITQTGGVASPAAKEFDVGQSVGGECV